MSDADGEGSVSTMDPAQVHDPLPISGSTDVSVVNLKLPPFWPGDPELWFTQIEALPPYHLRFDHVVASLSPDYATKVRDLLLRPRPTTDNPLKEQLTKHTALSEQRRLQQLFTGEELGDRKPTQLLRKMQQLLGDRPGIDPSFLQELRILAEVAPECLASTPEGTALSTLAEMAYKVMEFAAPSGSVAALKTHPPNDPPTPSAPSPLVTSPPATAGDIEDLRSEIK